MRSMEFEAVRPKTHGNPPFPPVAYRTRTKERGEDRFRESAIKSELRARYLHVIAN